jgi:hypothetical protein
MQAPGKENLRTWNAENSRHTKREVIALKFINGLRMKNRDSTSERTCREWKMSKTTHICSYIEESEVYLGKVRTHGNHHPWPHKDLRESRHPKGWSISFFPETRCSLLLVPPKQWKFRSTIKFQGEISIWNIWWFIINKYNKLDKYY